MRSAARYAEKLHDDKAAAHLVEAAAAFTEHKARNDLRPELTAALDEVGLAPRSIAESVSREKLVEDGAAWLLAADEYYTSQPTAEMINWARRALGIGEDLVHDGDCTKQPHTCRLCERERCMLLMRAALAAIEASGTPVVSQFEIRGP